MNAAFVIDCMHDASPLLVKSARQEVLARAWARIRSKGARGGVDGITTAMFQKNAARELALLREQLLRGTYTPEPLDEITIAKGSGKPGKRTLHLPAVRDKIAQEAVRDVIGPRLDRAFRDCSFAYRPNRNAALAIRRVVQHMEEDKLQYAALGDIHAFFDSINRERLQTQLRGHLHDPGVERLIQMWTEMGAVCRSGEWVDSQLGLHQGSGLSPLLANLYLTPFDSAMQARGYRLVRYADDFVILAASAEEAAIARETAARFLKERLNLTLNEGATPVASRGNGLTWLGVCFDESGLRLDPARLENAFHALEKLVSQARNKGWHGALRSLEHMSNGWRRYYGTMLPDESLETLNQEFLKTHAEICRTAVQLGAGREELLHAARAARPLLESGWAQHRRTLARIGERHRLMSSGAARRPSRPVPPAAPAATSAPAAESVEVRIRRRRRKHYRKQSDRAQIVVDQPGTFVGKRGATIILRAERRILSRLPVDQIRTVTLASRGVTISSDVLSLCAAKRIPLLVLTRTAGLAAVVIAPDDGDARTRVRQVEFAADAGLGLDLARSFVDGKIRNQRALILSLFKYRARQKDASAVGGFRQEIRRIRTEVAGMELAGAPEVERARLMSAEGRAAAAYWAMVKLALNDRWEFAGRNRHGARDLVNSMLNYGYAILESRVHLALIRASLLPDTGFLHAPQRGKPVLVYDAMEEFRPPIVDRVVFALLAKSSNLGQTSDGFLDERTRRKLNTAVARRMATLVLFRGRQLRLEQIIETQARGIGAHVRQERHYRPYVAAW